MRKSIAAIALIRHELDGETLWLAQWNERWRAFNFVGGHKHDDESFRDCLVREINEELGLHDGKDVLVAEAPAKHLKYIDISRRNGEETEYTIELFEVTLVGNEQAEIDNCEGNRWLSEPEIVAEVCTDGRPISPTPKRYLNELRQVCRRS